MNDDKGYEGNEGDRFDEAGMGVKKQFRPDWLDSENKLFINKLNNVAKNFSETSKDVSYFCWLIFFLPRYTKCGTPFTRTIRLGSTMSTCA